MSKIYQEFGTKIMEIEVTEFNAPIYQWRGNNVHTNYGQFKFIKRLFPIMR